MGAIDGTRWHTKLPIGSVMNWIQTPTVSPVAGASAVSNFATGIATQVGVGAAPVALMIHAIRWNIFPTTGLAAWADVFSVSLQGQITENVAQTAVALTDPRILCEVGEMFSSLLESAVGGQNKLDSFIWTAEFDPPIITIAQNLRIVGTSSSTIAFDLHAKLLYTVQAIDQAVRDNLMMRLNVATQP